VADLILVLSTFAAAAALWFKWSSARAGKRALALIALDAPQREPGMTLEVLGVTGRGVEIRVTNPAGAWNLVAGLSLEVGGRRIPGEPGTLTVPFVVAAGGTVTGQVCFRAHDAPGVLVLVDIDGRRREASPRPM
jgi:hypothetical protein